MNQMNNFPSQKLHEECGVFGVYQQPDASFLTFFGLHALQHRGQEAAGIACGDGTQILCVKGKGLVTDVFEKDALSQLTGANSIGHVRYSTEGGDEIENVQPILAKAHMGSLAVAHNGQIINAQDLRCSLEEKGSIFRGSSDSEIILHLIQRGKGSLLEKIQQACNLLDGAFAFLILTEKNLYAIRDKNGLRPLSIARKGNGFAVSSETCAFDLIGADYIRDVQPGEIVKFSSKGMQSFSYTSCVQERICAMEYIYFARPDSNICGRNVHTMRRSTGRILAKKDRLQGLQADIVIGVPDSSLSAAMGYSEESGLPYEMGLVKNRYVGRTFIEPTQAQRDMGVKMKLSANASVIQNKRIVLLDDSLVRGTTSKRIVLLLKEAGAKEVHVRIASPAILYPCFYGVDISSRKELISTQMSRDDLCAYLHADSLSFLSIQEMEEAYGGSSFCFSCFSGKYPTPLYQNILE